MKTNYPIYVLAKDCGEIMRFTSIAEMQRELERIDIENNEYTAWDCNGLPLQLIAQEPTWLAIEPVKNPENTHLLAAALESYAASLEIPLKIESPSLESLSKAYDQVRAKQQDRGLLRKLWAKKSGSS